jgi:hypothetical protein
VPLPCRVVVSQEEERLALLEQREEEEKARREAAMAARQVKARADMLRQVARRQEDENKRLYESRRRAFGGLRQRVEVEMREQAEGESYRGAASEPQWAYIMQWDTKKKQVGAAVRAWAPWGYTAHAHTRTLGCTHVQKCVSRSCTRSGVLCCTLHTGDLQRSDVDECMHARPPFRLRRHTRRR